MTDDLMLMILRPCCQSLVVCHHAFPDKVHRVDCWSGMDLRGIL